MVVGCNSVDDGVGIILPSDGASFILEDMGNTHGPYPSTKPGLSAEQCPQTAGRKLLAFDVPCRLWRLSRR